MFVRIILFSLFFYVYELLSYKIISNVQESRNEITTELCLALNSKNEIKLNSKLFFKKCNEVEGFSDFYYDPLQKKLRIESTKFCVGVKKFEKKNNLILDNCETRTENEINFFFDDKMFTILSFPNNYVFDLDEPNLEIKEARIHKYSKNWVEQQMKTSFLEEISSQSIFNIYLQQCGEYSVELWEHPILVMTDCNKTIDEQKFTFEKETKEIRANNQKCMEHSFFYAAFNECNGEENQKWILNENVIQPMSDTSLCLSVSQCGKVYVMECLKDEDNFQFNQSFTHRFLQ